MSNHRWRTITQAAVGSLLSSVICAAALPVLAQSAGDVVLIGNSPEQWARFQSYWNQLLGLNAPNNLEPQATEGQAFAPAGADPQALEQEIMSKLQVRSLQLKPIIGLGGSSEVVGSVTNGNDKPVTLGAVNYEIYDNSGALIQTGSAQPEPATIAPGQTVTFKDQLLTTPFRNKTIRLAKPGFVLQGGV